MNGSLAAAARFKQNQRKLASAHPGQQVELVLIAMAIAAVVLLWLSLRMRRLDRIVRDLPNSKVQSVFIGLVELNVTAESESPFTSFLGERLCVQYSYRIDEETRPFRAGRNRLESPPGKRPWLLPNPSWKLLRLSAITGPEPC